MADIITVTPMRPYILRSQLEWGFDCKAPTGIIVDRVFLEFFGQNDYIIPAPFNVMEWPQVLVPASPKHSLLGEIGKEQIDWIEYTINPKEAQAAFHGFLPQDIPGAVDAEVTVRIPLMAIIATLGPDGRPYGMPWEDYYVPKATAVSKKPSLSLVQ